MEEKQKKEKSDVKKYEKLIDWGIQTQLTWAVMFLACFVGLIELFPNVPRFGDSSPWESIYLGLVVAIYVFLVAGLDYSIIRTARIVRNNFDWAKESEGTSLTDELKKTRGWAVSLLFDKHGKILLWFAILLLTAVWLTILFLRVFLV